jgi:hypothetical protein
MGILARDIWEIKIVKIQSYTSKKQLEKELWLKPYPNETKALIPRITFEFREKQKTFDLGSKFHEFKYATMNLSSKDTITKIKTFYLFKPIRKVLGQRYTLEDEYDKEEFIKFVHYTISRIDQSITNTTRDNKNKLTLKKKMKQVEKRKTLARIEVQFKNAYELGFKKSEILKLWDKVTKETIIEKIIES